MPENIKGQPKLEKKNKSVEMKCCNIGCTKDYLSDKNTDKNCLNHPGKYDFGSELGMWPAGWTCCRKEWDAPPC